MSLKEELSFPNPIETKDHEAILSIILTGATIVKEGDKILKTYGLTVTQLNVLMILKYQAPEDGLNQTQLGDMLLVNRSNVTGLVDRMEKAGLVVRKDDPEDRRTKIVKLTKSGNEVLSKAEAKYFQVVEQIMKGFSKRETAELCDKLETIRTHLKERKD